MAQSPQIDRRYLRRTEISRDGWRERALKYQKRIRSLRISRRDLTASRDKWQIKAITAQNQLREKQAEIERLKQTITDLTAAERTRSNRETTRTEITEIVETVDTHNLDSDPIITAKPQRYLYPIFIIQLAIQQRIVCFTSWRGVAHTFKLWSQFFNLPTPSFNTIRQWFLKLGLFELQQPKEYRNDWIFLIDTTWGQGQKKCFLILGISYQQWKNKIQNNYSNLTHQDVAVLSLDVLDVSNGNIIAERLRSLTSKVGQPLQIISDHGPDIKKGVELYIEGHPEVIYTYDFTHQVALWLKYSFSENEVFQEFSQQADLSRNQIQLTSLSFLLPPKPRYKARYHNIDILVKWGNKVLNYWHKQNLSRISSNFETAKKQFLSKFGWLLDYHQQLSIYSETLQVFRTAKKFLYQHGLHQDSYKIWLKLSQKFPSHPWIQENVKKVTNYLISEGSKIPNSLVFPAISDIVESLFSKYKTFSSSAPYSEINEMILSMVLTTTKITPDKVLKAMTTISTSALNKWLKEVFGESMMTKRKAAFSNS